MTCKRDHEITQLAKNIQSLAIKAVTTYEREIDAIVNFSRYYYAIDRNAAAEYVLAYRRLFQT